MSKSSLSQQISNLTHKISDLEDKAKSLKDQATKLRNRMNTLVSKRVVDIYDESNEPACWSWLNDIYWKSEYAYKIIQQAVDKSISRTFVPQPINFEINCCDCGELVIRECKNWTVYH